MAYNQGNVGELIKLIDSRIKASDREQTKQIKKYMVSGAPTSFRIFVQAIEPTPEIDGCVENDLWVNIT